VERPLELSPRLRWWPSTLWQTTTLEIEREGARLMVDPGIAPWEVRSAAGGRRVDHVLITHADWDHVLGIPMLPEATVHAGAAAAERIASGEAWASVVAEARPFCIPLDGLQPLRVDDVLDPPCETTFGPWSASVWATPGHTPDCITTLLPDERLLVAGDYLSPLEIPYAYDSVAAYRETLGVLAGLIDEHRPEWVAIGHGAPLTADEARAVADEDIAYLDGVLAYAAAGGDPDTPEAVTHPQRGGAEDEDAHRNNVRDACTAAAAA
jgi:glyoxylase-like metal-dependent hydrolase (beta-lactamase superfamily II)